jgi:uncharacterized protein YacL (UPF0231 family)
MINDWRNKRLRDFTLEDAMQAYDDGFFTICGDGDIKCLQNYEEE